MEPGAGLNDHRIIELQNYTGWKGPLEIIESNPPAKAVFLDQIAQVVHNLPGQPSQCLATVLKFFLISRLNFPWCNLRPFPLIVSLVTLERRLAITAFQHIACSDPSRAFLPSGTLTFSHFGVICKLSEGALNPTLHVTYKDVKQHQSQHRSMRNTTRHSSPIGH